MANLTLVIEEDLLLRARKKALDQGTSVNAVVRNYLEDYAGRPDASEAMRAFVKHAASFGARSKKPWTREELYDR
jgi:hypothetical protein